MDELDLRKIVTVIILGLLIVLSFILLKPIILSIIVALILAFLFVPTYKFLLKKLKSPNLSASIITVFLILIIILPVWFLTPIFIDQSFKIYQETQQMDFVTPLKTIFPSIFASDEFSAEVGTIIRSFVSNALNSFMSSVSKLILNFPTLFLQLLVVFFTFFFVLRDQEKLILYIKSLLPFSKDVEKRLFEYTKGITISVINGQVIIGLIQGFVVGIGFFLFGVPNALILTLLACLAGVFPIIGTTIIWLPVALYLLLAGNIFSAVGLTIFGIISTFMDNLLRPIIVSKRAKMPSVLILIGMIGGLFFFGVLGFILGPLILAYLLILVEVYRKNKDPEIFVSECN